jgi:UDPglucose 6-dehydrogenase
MKIGIIGKGTVGGAVYEGLEYLGHSMSFFDPKYKESTLADVLDTEVVFISVPTDQTSNGDCDTSIVDRVVEELNVVNYKGLVSIKSTVVPGTTDRLQKQYPDLRMSMVPEFLRAKSALSDFIHNHDLLVVGCYNKHDADIIVELHGDFPQHVAQVSPTEAEIIKYFNNVHHAMSVTFANITSDVCDKMGADYMNVYKAITKRGCFNSAYLMSNKNMRGYGGHCLPKDTSAWNNLIKNLDLPYTMIQSVITDNEKVKKQ